MEVLVNNDGGVSDQALTWPRGEVAELQLFPAPSEDEVVRLTVAHGPAGEPFVEYVPSVADATMFVLAPESIWYFAEGHSYRFEVWRGAAGQSPSRIARGTMTVSGSIAPGSAPIFGDSVQRALDAALRAEQAADRAEGGDGGGADVRSIESEAYDPATGILTLIFTDGSTFQTGDLRGTDGSDGDDGVGQDGDDGRGIESEAYDPATGVLTLTFTDGSTFATGDLRGTDGASFTVLTFGVDEEAEYEAARAAHVGDPRYLVIRYVD